MPEEALDGFVNGLYDSLTFKRTFNDDIIESKKTTAYILGEATSGLLYGVTFFQALNDLAYRRAT